MRIFAVFLAQLDVCAVITALLGNVNHVIRIGATLNNVRPISNNSRAQTENPVLGCASVHVPDAHVRAIFAAFCVKCFRAKAAHDNEATCTACSERGNQTPTLSGGAVLLVDLHVRAVVVITRINVKRFARKNRRDGEQLVAVGIYALFAYVEALCDGLVAFPTLHVAAVGSTRGGNVKHGAVFGFNNVSAAFDGAKRWFRT